MLKRTPLFTAHQELGGKLVEFGGWEMPVQYTSITEEHLAVRRGAGIFDISHMGEVLVTGYEASNFLNHVLTNDVAKLDIGQGHYTLLCNERGGVIDDLYAYRLGANEFLLVINASRIESDVAWLKRNLSAFLLDQGASKAIMADISNLMGAVAIQGPRVAQFINSCFPGEPESGTIASCASDLKKNKVGRFSFEEKAIWVARTGYTGEDGFEIIAPAEIIQSIWKKVLDVGRPFGLKPCGLGARDTLRTEAGYPLYGHELDESTTPIEAGLDHFVALDKGYFIGRSVLVEQHTDRPKKKLIAFKMTGKSAPPRPHYPIWAGGAKVGEVTSGTQSPSLNIGIGLGFVPPEFAKRGTPIEIEIRGKRAPAAIAAKPIYRKT
jgi:aminomethyltransferase